MRNFKAALFFIFLFPTLLFADSIVRIAPLTISVKSNTTTVTGTATAIPATALKGRESIAIYNVDNSTETIYIGDSTVTTANGFPLTSSAPVISIDADDSVVIYAISDGTSINVRSLEIK